MLGQGSGKSIHFTTLMQMNLFSKKTPLHSYYYWIYNSSNVPEGKINIKYNLFYFFFNIRERICSLQVFCRFILKLCLGFDL